jgi:predicted metal-dependent phosphotriesterase family hydrolase
LGLTQEQLDKVFIDNPARILTIDLNPIEVSRGSS